MDKDTTSKDFIIKYYKWYNLRSKLQHYLVNNKDAARDITDEVVHGRMRN